MRKIIPKRVPQGKLLDEDEWRRMWFYTKDEVREMTEAFDLLILRLTQWVVAIGADEEEIPGVLPKSEPSFRFARFVWGFYPDVAKLDKSIFKTIHDQRHFSPRPLELIASQMPHPPISPKGNQTYRPEMARDSSDYETRSLELQKKIAQGVTRLASDSLVDGEAHVRAGTPGEIAQENEVVGRYHANGDRGLRGFVAQVLREAKWQLKGGHPNTESGKARCYNRVYAILHPNRRRK